MKFIDIQVVGNDQKVVPAQMAICDQCNGNTFLNLVINGHNHLECTSCGTSYCQGGCDHGCKDDSCDRSHCAKCGGHMMGEYLPHGTLCDSCQNDKQLFNDLPLCTGFIDDPDESDLACPYCGSGLMDEKGNCKKCGL